MSGINVNNFANKHAKSIHPNTTFPLKDHLTRVTINLEMPLKIAVLHRFTDTIENERKAKTGFYSGYNFLKDVC
jgi:hypothetical protein